MDANATSLAPTSQAQSSVFQSLKALWRHIRPKRRRQFALLFILMIAASFAEIVSIGAVLPFLAVLTQPQRVMEFTALQPLIAFFHIESSNQLLLPLTILFGIATLFAAAMRVGLILANTRLTFVTGADLSYAIYERTLYQDYEVHLNRNSSVIIDGILNKTSAVIFGNVLPVLTLVSSSVMLILILTALIWADPQTALTAFSGFGLIYACVLLLTKKRLRRNSQLIFREQAQVIKTLQEGLGGIRDVLLDGSQEAYCAAYQRADLLLRRAQGSNTFLTLTPRYLVEALGMLFIAALAYFMSKDSGGMNQTVPILGVLALGAQRIVPIMEQVYGSITNIRASHASLNGALELLDQKLPSYLDHPPKVIAFKHSITLDRLSFRYSKDTPWIFEDLQLTLHKGERIGIVGETGCGKSTLLDLLMALLTPTSGVLKIDDQVIDPNLRRAWQAHLAHVPQAIYLSDSTISENIAFGIPKDQIDLTRVMDAAKKAQIHDTVLTWPQQYDTLVGERGVRLSGGQRQRIGIARALYKQADVIIFDEATSALDNETEEALIQTIDKLQEDITIIMIAHRLTTLRSCTRIIELVRGKPHRELTYAQIQAN
jgi:ABC-type multidrug transport system fused ATPase/permease subunit